MRNLLSSLAMAAIALCSTPVAAQQVFPLAPTNTFYRTNSDPNATDAYSLPIGAFGVSPGGWLKLRCVGAWNNGVSGDVLQDMVGCFAANGVVLANTNLQRLPLPIAAGTAIHSNPTAVGNLTTDINEDFWISRTGTVSEVTIQVPPGTVHLFVAVPDSFYSDNTDPNADLGIEVTVISPSAYPGSLEDCELGTSIGTAPLDTLDTKSAVAGNVIHAAIRSPLNTQAGNLCVIVADLRVTGVVPAGPLPKTYFGSTAAIVLPFSVMPSLASTSTININVPPRMTGLSLWLQGGTLWPDARNTLCTLTNAHVIRLL